MMTILGLYTPYKHTQTRFFVFVNLTYLTHYIGQSSLFTQLHILQVAVIVEVYFIWRWMLCRWGSLDMLNI